jgi:hypothetical protein
VSAVVAGSPLGISASRPGRRRRSPASATPCRTDRPNRMTR